MPRDLFGDVTDPSITLGTRKWYSVPLSFAAHTVALGALIVAPLVATGALPMPDGGPVIINLEPPPLPQPPPVRRPAPVNPQVDVHAAPTIAPDRIAPEVDLPSAINQRMPISESTVYSRSKTWPSSHRLRRPTSRRRRKNPSRLAA